MRESAAFRESHGARVHVQSWGDGPTVLGLHGLGGGAHFFETMGRALAGRYRTLALDFPGSGLSPSTPAPSFEAFAAIAADIAADGASRPLALIGHSMGTIVALEALRQAPGLAPGLIAVGGLPQPLPDARARIAARADAIARSGLVGLGTEVAGANLARQTMAERPGLVALFGRLFEMQSPEGYVATARMLAAWTSDRLPPLDGVTCLLVAGDEDRYAPPDAMRRFQAALPEGTTLELLSGCGHLPFLERPAEFAAIVRAFLERLRRR
jgi:3-oxoadipate enol-lactonase